MPQAQVLALFGPTAVGKSALAHAAALALGGEVVVADPFQRYRGLEIAADAPGAAARAAVPYHFVGDLGLSEASSAGEYALAATAAIDEIIARGRVPIVAGGSGLYLRGALGDLEFAPRAGAAERAAVEALVAVDADAARRELAARDPAAAARVDARNPRRLARALEVARKGGRGADRLWDAPDRRPTLLAGVVRPRDILDRLIAARVERELSDGLVAEIERAIAVPGLSREAAQIIGAREVRAMREGALPPEQLAAQLAARTRRLARRQLSWLRRMRADVTIDLAGRPAITALPAVLRAWRGARAVAPSTPPPSR